MMDVTITESIYGRRGDTMDKIKYAKIQIYTDGIRRCGNCGQRISNECTKCPACKVYFNQIEMNKQKDAYSTQGKDQVELKGHKKKKLLAFILVLIICCALIYISRGYMPDINEFIKDNDNAVTSIFQKSNNRHTESPVGEETSDIGGFSYRINQIFFETKQNIKTEEAIRQFFKDTNIIFENLYYTDSGYYTADLTGYKETTKEEYEKQSDTILEQFSNWSSDFGDLRITRCYVQGSYKRLN